MARRPYKIVTSKQRPTEEQNIEVSGKKILEAKGKAFTKTLRQEVPGKGVGNSRKASVAGAE